MVLPRSHIPPRDLSRDLLTETVTVPVSLAVKDQLAEVARREDRSVASVVRRAVEGAIGGSITGIRGGRS